MTSRTNSDDRHETEENTLHFLMCVFLYVHVCGEKESKKEKEKDRCIMNRANLIN